MSSYVAPSPWNVTIWPPTPGVRSATPNSRPSRATVAPTSAAWRSSTSAASTGCCARMPNEPGLMIPAFSTAMSAGRVAEVARVVDADRRDRLPTAASATLVASQVPPMPDLDDGGVDRGVGERRERHRGDELEERQRVPAGPVDDRGVRLDLVVDLDEPLLGQRVRRRC